MMKKSTGVFVIGRNNQPYELNNYQLFVREQCKILREKNIHIPGRGNTMKYVANLWQMQKQGKKLQHNQPSFEPFIEPSFEPFIEPSFEPFIETSIETSIEPFIETSIGISIKVDIFKNRYYQNIIERSNYIRKSCGTNLPGIQV